MKGLSGGLANLMKQANQMQIKMKKMQEELSAREFNGSSGGGAMRITVNGDCQMVKVEIDPEVLKAADPEMIQDMILLAANEALKSAKEVSSQEMQKITGGMNMPGLF